MKFKIQGEVDHETISVKVVATDEQEAIEKAKKKYQMVNPRHVTSMRVKQQNKEESIIDKAWNRKGSPYIKVDRKGRSISIFA